MKRRPCIKWIICHSPVAFTGLESGAAGLSIGHQFHRSGSHDLLHRDTAAALDAGDPFIPIANGWLAVRCWPYRSARYDSHHRAALGARLPRDGGLDYITFRFVEEHVVPAAKTGLSTGLTIVPLEIQPNR